MSRIFSSPLFMLLSMPAYYCLPLAPKTRKNPLKIMGVSNVKNKTNQVEKVGTILKQIE